MMKDHLINFWTSNKESLESYALGGGLTTAAIKWAEIVTFFQSLAIVLGCLVVAVRLIHDIVRLIRYLKGDRDAS
jgi:hypothetical protein